MLKVLIIDDDTFTRKGISMMMPWTAHNMTIVGEAVNGNDALAFLKQHEVDLALVDIDMPVMNGLEFIARAKPLYPDLEFVVLTVHTEFEYVQDVLRLGAIDYIAKSHFDKENFDLILKRIYTGIMKKRSLSQKNFDINWRRNKIGYPDIYTLITLDTYQESNETIDAFFTINSFTEQAFIYELTSGIWMFYNTGNQILFPEKYCNTMLLKITDVANLTFHDLGKLLRNYKQYDFFYDYSTSPQIILKKFQDFTTDIQTITEQELLQISDEWYSLTWIHNRECFTRMKSELKNRRLFPSKLYQFLTSLKNIWNRSYSQLLGETLHLPESFHNWQEVELWLTNMFDTTNRIQLTIRYSPEIVNSILSVKNYVDHHYYEAVQSQQLAKQANMSYSYFSRCFHDIIGISFNNYFTSVRMDKAKDYLLHSHKNIQEIALSVGYTDEKYFSKLFRKSTGQTPSEYRREQLKIRI